MTLRRIMRQTGLPPEVLLDLALEMLDIASRKLSPSPIKRQAVGLGAARSQGDWADASVGQRRRAVNTITLTRRVNLTSKSQAMENLPRWCCRN